MNLDPKILKELHGVFQNELDQQSQVITDSLLELEKATTKIRARQLLNEMYRAAHNIKGAARGIGLTRIADVAHKLESLFNGLHDTDNVVSPELVDLSLQCLDFMKSATGNNSGEPAVTGSAEDLIEYIENFWKADRHKSTKTSSETAKKRTGDRDSGESPAQEIPDTPDHGETPPERADLQHQPNGSSEPTSILVPVDRMDRVAAFVEELQITKSSVSDYHVNIGKLGQRVEQIISHWDNLKQLVVKMNGAVPEDVKNTFLESIHSVKELQNDVTRLQRITRTDGSKLKNITDNLQNNLRIMRLVPAQRLLQTLVRSVRDISRELGKQVEFNVSGGDIGMDRSILNSLRDPLLHILRNSIDHGIEPEKIRKERGKPASGQITLTVDRSGNEIQIIVADDGNGIDVNLVRSAANAKGIFNSSELASMPDEEVIDLIFRPGFSTKEIVTNISGRGIGLDVVRTNLQALKGNVTVESGAARGTTFRLRVPLTLTTERGLLVQSGKYTFAVPNSFVYRTLNVKADEIFDLEANLAISIENKPVPVRDLCSILGLDHHVSPKNIEYQIIVISNGWRKVALLVDRILDERDIVIKQLPPPLYAVPNIAGACLLGNGRTVIILNPEDLIETSLSTAARPMTLEKPEDQGPTKKRILVVDDSITTRTLVRNILEAKGFDITSAVDGKEGWEKLQNNSFDLVVTDVQMPVVDGFQLTNMIKSHEKLRDIPVVIVTSLANETDKKRGIEVGADAYIVKGDFETRVLLEVINQFI